MKKEGKRITKKGIIYGCFLFIVLLAISIPFVIRTDPDRSNFEELSIDDGWHVEASGKTYENMTISQNRFDMQNRGDVFYMSRTLPIEQEVDHPVLCVYSMHCYLQVFLDGELIYDYGHKSKLESLLPGYGMQVIPISDNYSGKKVEIYYYVQENRAFDGLQGPVIMNSTYRTQNLISRNRINALICMFLVIFGLVGMFGSAILCFRNQVFLRTFSLTLFSFTIGIWSMCNNELMSLLFMNVSEKSYIEYLSFYLISLSFMLYFHDRVAVKGLPLWIKIYYLIVVGGQLICYVAFIVLHFTGLCSFPHFVTWEHIFLIFAILFFVLLNVAERKLYHKTEWRITIGFAIATILSLVEMIRFNVQKFITGFENNKYNSSLAIGVLIIVLTLTIDFSSKVLEALYRDAKNQLLQQMAYLDELTGLFNRRQCEEKLRALEKYTRRYAIINLDMNLLKAINDTFGHDVGDRALKNFAEVLRDSFPEKAEICRMGGDEFAIILMDANEAQAMEGIRKMNEEMERRNAEDDIITLSTAYGCAFSTECENPHAVYRLADQRMYACKKEMHLGRES